MKSIIISIMVCVFIATSGFQAFGEEWTAEQKEVWNAVVADIDNFKKGDVEKVLEARHDNFVGWFGTKEGLHDKTASRAFYKSWFDYDTPTKFDLEPVKILIMGSVANAYYIFDLGGNLISTKGRGIDTLVKENNKWLLMSHICCSCEQPVPCK